MARVELSGVEKTYPDGFRAVKELDLVVEDGEFVVLVGPSGCGKSTTLRMIAGLEELSAGTVSIGGRVVNELPGRDRDVAMVFQSYALYPHLDVRANLSFGLLRRRRHASLLKRAASSEARAAHRDEMAAIRARVDETARLLGIEALLARKPGALSGGQRQRVALGRAIVRDPAVYLFDEPLSNLDARLRLETRAELKSLHARVGATSIYVTHDQEEAMTLGDRLVVMKDGVVQQCAPPTEIYERPANRFVAGFVGTPPMNFLPARRAGGGALELVGETASVQLPPALERALDADGATDVVLGLRPDRMAPAAAGEGDGVPAEVVTVENLGDRWDVVCALPSGARVTSRVLPDPALARGARVRLCRELSGAHLFRPGETGARIG